eukprot:6203287-Pleurochrysis_carterae.AAC.1
MNERLSLSRAVPFPPTGYSSQMPSLDRDTPSCDTILNVSAVTATASDNNPSALIPKQHEAATNFDEAHNSPSLSPSGERGANGIIVITGGLRGLGRCVGRWLLERGHPAERILLLGRNLPARDADFDDLVARGVKVQICDVCKKDDVEMLPDGAHSTNSCPQ